MELGFNPRQMITASYDLVLQNYPAARREAFRRELVARLEALPGVTSASIANVPPLSGIMYSTIVTSTDDRGEPVEGRAYMNAVGPRYFTTLEMPLVAGREIGVEDGRGAPGAAVINETLARRLWPGVDALGRTMRLDGATLEVVGVARDAGTTSRPRIRVRSCSFRSPSTRRSTVTPPSSGRRTRRCWLGRLCRRRFARSTRRCRSSTCVPSTVSSRTRADKQRGVSALFAGFGLLALLLAALGLYGVMTYAVTRRTREMGVRLALGATPAQLTRLIAGDGLRLALTGVAIEARWRCRSRASSARSSSACRLPIFAAFAGTCALLVAVALVAAALPARRAACWIRLSH